MVRGPHLHGGRATGPDGELPAEMRLEHRFSGALRRRARGPGPGLRLPLAHSGRVPDMGQLHEHREVEHRRVRAGDRRDLRDHLRRSRPLDRVGGHRGRDDPRTHDGRRLEPCPRAGGDGALRCPPRPPQRAHDHEAEDLVPGGHAGDALDLPELRARRERRPDDHRVRQARLLGPRRLRQQRDRAVPDPARLRSRAAAHRRRRSALHRLRPRRSSRSARTRRPRASTASTSGASCFSRTPSRGSRPGWPRWCRWAVSPAPPHRPTRRCS